MVTHAKTVHTHSFLDEHRGRKRWKRNEAKWEAQSIDGSVKWYPAHSVSDGHAEETPDASYIWSIAMQRGREDAGRESLLHVSYGLCLVNRVGQLRLQKTEFTLLTWKCKWRESKFLTIWKVKSSWMAAGCWRVFLSYGWAPFGVFTWKPLWNKSTTHCIFISLRPGQPLLRPSGVSSPVPTVPLSSDVQMGMAKSCLPRTLRRPNLS